MGGSSQAPVQTTQTTQQVPAYLQSAQQQAIGSAQNLQKQPFQYYGGQAVADLSPMQNQYFQSVENNQGMWQPTTQAAEGVMGNVAAGGYTPQIQATQANLQDINPSSIASGMGKYYDPAISTELGGMQAAIQNNTDISNARADRSAGMQHAFGGSGSALLNAENDKNGQLAMGQYASQLLPQAFNTAAQLSGQDISNRQSGQIATGQQNLQSNAQNLGFQQLAAQTGLGAGQLALQGAQGLNNTGLGAQKAAYTDTTQLGMAGQAAQDQAQAYLNFPMQQYQQALQYPFQTQAAVDSALGVVAPYSGIGQTSTTSQPYSPLSGAMGTALAGTALLGGLGSAYRSFARAGGHVGALPRKFDDGGYSTSEDAFMPYPPDPYSAADIIAKRQAIDAANPGSFVPDPEMAQQMADDAKAIADKKKMDVMPPVADDTPTIPAAFPGPQPGATQSPNKSAPTILPPVQVTVPMPEPPPGGWRGPGGFGDATINPELGGGYAGASSPAQGSGSGSGSDSDSGSDLIASLSDSGTPDTGMKPPIVYGPYGSVNVPKPARKPQPNDNAQTTALNKQELDRLNRAPPDASSGNSEPPTPALPTKNIETAPIDKTFTISEPAPNEPTQMDYPGKKTQTDVKTPNDKSFADRLSAALQALQGSLTSPTMAMAAGMMSKGKPTGIGGLGKGMLEGFGAQGGAYRAQQAEQLRRLLEMYPDLKEMPNQNDSDAYDRLKGAARTGGQQ